MNPNKRLEIVAESFATNLLDENIISKENIILKFRVAINLLLPKVGNKDQIRKVDFERKNTALIEAKKVNRKLNYEREFWKKIALMYIGDSNKQQYYDRLHQELKKNKLE